MSPASADLSWREPDWALHLQALHRYFFEAADDACLLWVDPAQGDPYEDDALVAARRVRVPISHPRFDLRFAPYLVPLDLARSADADVFQRSVRMAWEAWQPDSLAAANGQPIPGWVRTSAPPAELARHWGVNCHLHARGGLHKLLRLHDPGVREWLWPALQPAQRHQLLGPAQAIVSVARSGQLQRHELEDSALAGMAAAAPARLVLSDEQWAEVDDYATVHAAWVSELATRGASRFDARGALVALRHATRYHITDAQDRTLFARHALLLGPQFHHDPRLAPVWQLTANGEFYGSAVEEVTGVAADALAEFLLPAQPG